jgi:hypothetical protein
MKRLQNGTPPNSLSELALCLKVLRFLQVGLVLYANGSQEPFKFRFVAIFPITVRNI